MTRWNLCICVVAALVYAVKAQDWSWETADTWADTYSECGGDNQSPLYLRTSGDVVKKSFGDLEGEGISYKLLNYDKDVSGTFSNTGRVLALTFNETPEEETPAFELTEDGTTTVYYLKSAVLHVNSTHTINGGRYYLELDLIHEDSEGKTLGVALLPLRCNDPGPLANTLLEQFDSLVDPGTSVDLEAFPAKDLLGEKTDPEKLCELMKYSGSMITPPCTEGVTWFVMYNERICFTMDQIYELASAQNNDGNPIQGFRPAQEANGRTWDWIRC